MSTALVVPPAVASDVYLRAGAVVLIEHHVIRHGLHMVVRALRRAGLSPEAALYVCQAIVRNTRYGEFPGREAYKESNTFAEMLGTVARRAVTEGDPYLRQLLPPQLRGPHERAVWQLIGDALCLPQCSTCAVRMDDAAFKACADCRTTSRRRVHKHRATKAAVSPTVKAPRRYRSRDDDARRERRWRDRVLKRQLPPLSKQGKERLRKLAADNYGHTCRDCGERMPTFLHFHHPNGHGRRWRKIAGDKPHRELQQLELDAKFHGGRWPSDWLVRLCRVCHAIEHGLPADVVEKLRVECAEQGSATQRMWLAKHQQKDPFKRDGRNA